MRAPSAGAAAALLAASAAAALLAPAAALLAPARAGAADGTKLGAAGGTKLGGGGSQTTLGGGGAQRAPGDCLLPGTWTGYSAESPVDETYLMAWATNASAPPGAFTVTMVDPPPGHWTYAFGQLSADNATVALYFPEKDAYIGGPATFHCQRFDFNNTSEWAKQREIKRVHTIFASHLDVGFT